MKSPEVDAFLRKLGEGLERRGRSPHRLAREAGDHLDEAVRDLVAGGLPEKAAVREALARFGEVEDLAERYAREVPRGAGERMKEMAKLLMLVCATITTSGALLVGLATAADPDATALWSAYKLVAVAAITATGTVTFLWGRRREPRLEPYLLVGGFLLLAGGGAGVAWTVHLGLSTGDWE